MSIITRSLKQKAVYWPPGTNDDFGRMVFGTPVEIKCRWVDIADEYIDRLGEVKTSRSKVNVDRDLEIDGILWLGLLVDADEDTPFDNEGAYPIKMITKTPNLRATEFVRTCIL